MTESKSFTYTPANADKEVPPELVWDLFLKRWRYHGVVCSEDVLKCPNMEAIRTWLQSKFDLNPEWRKLGTKQEWPEVLRMLRSMKEPRQPRTMDGLWELIDFDTLTQELMEAPEHNLWYGYLPWITAIQRAYLDEPPEQPVGVFTKEKDADLALPPHLRRVVFEIHDVIGRGGRAALDLYKKANDNRRRAHVGYSLTGLPSSPYLNIINEAPPDPWLNAWLIFQTEPYYRGTSDGMGSTKREDVYEFVDDLEEFINHKTTLEAVAELTLGDSTRWRELAAEWRMGDKKAFSDAVAYELKERGWAHKRIDQSGDRKVRWYKDSEQSSKDSEQSSKEAHDTSNINGDDFP